MHFLSEKKCEIIKACELPSSTLVRISTLVDKGCMLTQRQINTLKSKISEILIEREAEKI